MCLFERAVDQTFVPTKELREVEIERALRLLRSTQLSADADSNGGAGVQIEFRRILVWPGGREEEVDTPKSLPPPDASHALPKPTDPTDDTNEGAV
jgi:hypothetical protein